MIDILRAVGEDGRRGAVTWLLLNGRVRQLGSYGMAARTMLRFRFLFEAASGSQGASTVGNACYRWLGISIPALLTVRVAQLAYQYRPNPAALGFHRCLAVW